MKNRKLAPNAPKRRYDMNIKGELKALGITQKYLKEYINSKGITISANTISSYVRNTDRGLPRTERIIEAALGELEERYNG